MRNSMNEVQRALLILRTSMERYGEVKEPEHRKRIRTEIENAMNELEKSLSSVASTLDDGYKVDPAVLEEVRRNREAFFRYEIRTAQMYVQSTTELQEFVERALASKKRAAHGGVARLSTASMLALVKSETSGTIAKIDAARTMSRKKKKKEKEQTVFRYWLATLGTAMVVADIGAGVVSAGIATPAAIASMTLGTGALGAVAFNNADVLKSAMSAGQKDKKKSESADDKETGER